MITQELIVRWLGGCIMVVLDVEAEACERAIVLDGSTSSGGSVNLVKKIE